MQTAFFEALVNRRHRVLGRWLHDFCLYDVLFLEIAENPLWLGGSEPSLSDLSEAVRICSLPPERLLRAEAAPHSILERCTHRLWTLAITHSHRDPAFLPREIASFRGYVADFYAVPAMWDAAAGGRRIRAPWILSLASFIESHSNMVFREIMTAPIGLMHWRAETLAERRGESLAELMTQDEIAIGEEQRRAMEESGETFPEDDAGDDDEREGGA